MRQRTHYKIFHAGVFKQPAATYDLAVEFMNSLDPQQVISVCVTPENKVIVWYRDR